MSLLSGLNTEQRQAAEHQHGPLLVVAGAGSGKTRALTYRIAKMLESGVLARQILAVTFTNKAAKEMKDRVAKLLQLEESDYKQMPLIGTFHSIGVRILRREIEALNRDRSFTIYDGTDTLSLAKRLLKSQNIAANILAPRALLSVISSWKSSMILPKKALMLADNRREHMIAELYEAYQKALLSSNAVDFDDLLLLPVQIFQGHSEVLKKYQTWWKYVMIDEYQDTNELQYLFAKLITQEHRNLCVIGDSDQSIYKFRGADMQNIINFQKEYDDAKIVKLEQNYRSTQNILEAADAVISQNTDRIHKTMFTENGKGEEITVTECTDEREEAQAIFSEISILIAKGKSPNDIAILYRTNAQSRALEEAALRNAIAYQIVGGLKFYARAEVKDILAYLRCILNPDDEVSLDRIINVPARKIGKTSLLKLKRFAFDQKISVGKAIEHISIAEGLPPAAKKSIQKFDSIIQTLRKKEGTIPVSQLIEEVITLSKYDEMLATQGEEGAVRLENIRELISVATKYDHQQENALALFLEEVALVSDLDNMEEKKETVTFMTLHAAKGLEFPIVFLAGCEENIFPSSRSFANPEDLEEERRLMYVGITRAEQKLFVTFATSRMLYGDIMYNSPSRFIAEIPDHLCDGNFFSQNSYAAEFTAPQAVVMESTFAVNELVDHPSFGLGKITAIQGDILTVHFKESGIKRLAGSVAPLGKIDASFL